MEYLVPEPLGPVLVGLANGPMVARFLERHRALVDYIEVAFEQIRHHPPTVNLQEDVPILLHCSSMSVAGYVPPRESTLDAIDDVARQTRTPWIGEHLAFILADPLDHNGTADPIELTYTICPQLSPDTIERVDENLRRLRGRFAVPIILENSPQYFSVPGSTMSMPQFVAQVAQGCDVDLLLDVTHFLITTSNMELDPIESLHTLPLERVVEIHFSGMSMQSGRWWDDHSAPAPDAAFDLLETAKDRIRAKAVTFEYNWASSMPETVVIEQIARARELLAR
jgi:uncharacterized protein